MNIKVVINRCFGGFGLSKKAILRMRELGSDWAKRVLFYGDKHPWQDHVRSMRDDSFSFAASEKGYWERIQRDDPILVQVVEELGPEASGDCAELEVVELICEIDVEEYDGMETANIIVTTHEEY